MRYLTFMVFTSAMAAALAACGSGEQANNRSNAGGRNAGTGPSSKAGSANNATDDDSTTSGGTGTLAPWLFSLTEAQAINPLVLPFEAASANDNAPPQSSSLTRQKNFISEILSDIMVLPAHSPGRDFKVTVTDDDSPNASALNQSLVINKGIMEFAPNLSLALVICHEAAHSGRNHSAKAEAQIQEYENKNKAKADALDTALQDLVETNYNPGTEKFTHRQSDYDRIKPLWDAFWGDFTNYQKRFESEADIVGARMCANAGFTQSEVVEGFTSLFKLFQGLTQKKLSPGTYTVREEEIGDFLHSIYSDDTHPTDREREDQILRVKQAFRENSIKDIAERWKNDFPKTGLSLTPSFSLSVDAALKHRSPADDAAVARTQRVLKP